MEISDQRVAYLKYVLRNSQGEELERSNPEEPLAYLHGNGSLIPGLEKGLAGAQAGDKRTVTVPPEEGYGLVDKGLVQKVPKRAFKGIRDLRVGQRLETSGPSGPEVVIVKAISGDMVTVDGNHELAGQTLVFDVEIVEVRAATQEEMMHGHVHGAGGHHH